MTILICLLVGQLVGWLVGSSVCHNFLKAREVLLPCSLFFFLVSHSLFRLLRLYSKAAEQGYIFWPFPPNFCPKSKTGKNFRGGGGYFSGWPEYIPLLMDAV